MDYIFDASQVHFRAALDRAHLASEHRRESENDRQQGLSGVEPRNRETDAAIATVMLTQAAAEAYASWVHIRAGRHPGFMKWQQAWKELPAAAAELGRSDDFALSTDQAAALIYMGAWRNYLMHTDPNVRDRLHAVLVQRKLIVPEAGEEAIVKLLNADLALWAITTFEELFRWAEEHTGIPAPFAEGAWLGERFRRIGAEQ
jgi:hypothetical protein